MNAFHLNKNGEPLPNESGRAGDIEYTRHVADIFFAILYESISATQQVIAIFKAVLRHSLIEHIRKIVFIIQNIEIKVLVFNQTNIKINNKGGSKKKKIQGIVTDEKGSIAMTNMTVCYDSTKQQSTTDYPYDLYQIKAMGVTISTGCRCKYKSIKNEIRY